VHGSDAQAVIPADDGSYEPGGRSTAMKKLWEKGAVFGYIGTRDARPARSR